MSQRRTPPAWIRAGYLIRYIIVISMIGAIGTVLLDEFAHAAEAPPMVRSLVIPGSAALFALGGVVLYDKFISPWRS